MAYGLLATGANGIFQIDSSLSTTVQLAVHSSGTVAANGTVTGLTANDIVFANVTSAQYSAATSNQGKVEVIYSGTTVTFRYPANYIVLKATTSINATTSTSAWNTENGTAGYGLQVKNASGDICFDTRYIGRIGGFKITKVIGKNTLNGGTYNFENGAATYNPAANEVESGTISNKYVAVYGGYYTGTTTNGEVRGGFTFDYSVTPNNKLYYRGYWANGQPGLGIPTYLPLPNQSEILVGELLT